MGNLTVKQDGTGDYTTLAAALADVGLTSGDTITITGTWTVADTAACTVADAGITITADADAAHDGFVALQGGAPGSETAAGHYRLEVADGNHCITNNQSSTIQKIVIRQNGAGSSDEGIRAAADVVAEQCIIYTDDSTNDQDGIYTSGNGVDITVRNCIIYGWNRAGIHWQNFSGAVTGSVTVDSCTIWDCGHADNSFSTDRAIGGVGIVTNNASSSITVNIDNTIIVDCSSHSNGADYAENALAGTRTFNISNSVDSDNSIAARLDSGSGNLASRTATDSTSPGTGDWIIFEDITTPPYDLRIVSNAENDAEDAGATTLTVDIAGTSRPQNSTDDIGAFEIVAGGAGSFTLTAESASFALTGNASTLAFHRVFPLDAGSYTLTGADATLALGRSLNAGAGEFNLTGNDAALVVDRQLTAESASYALTGADATLSYSGADKTLTAEVGSFALTGADAGLKVGRVLQAEAASITFTGADASFIHTTAGAKTLTAEPATFTLTGADMGIYPYFTPNEWQYLVDNLRLSGNIVLSRRR